jgi:hypothetical protein
VAVASGAPVCRRSAGRSPGVPTGAPGARSCAEHPWPHELAVSARGRLRWWCVWGGGWGVEVGGVPAFRGRQPRRRHHVNMHARLGVDLRSEGQWVRCRPSPAGVVGPRCGSRRPRGHTRGSGLPGRMLECVRDAQRRRRPGFTNLQRTCPRIYSTSHMCEWVGGMWCKWGAGWECP